MIPPDSSPQTPGRPTSSTQPPVDPLVARLRAEAKAPYRGLRQTFYVLFAASGLLGGFIFLLKLIAGEDPATNLGNLGLQLGVVAAMVWLYRRERPENPPGSGPA